MLAQSGSDDIFALVGAAIQRVSGLIWPSSFNYSPHPDAFPASVVTGFVEAFRGAVRTLAESNQTWRERGMGWLIRAMQRNADLTPLYRRKLEGVINEVCMSGGDIGALIETTLADWRGVFNCPADGTVALAGWLTAENVVLNLDGSLRSAEEFLSPMMLASFAPAPRARPRHRWLFEVAALNQMH
jgi:hypothetical protein